MSLTPVIHVVDDDERLRIALLRLLHAAGFEARGYAATGEFLLHPLPDHAGCLLLDVNLPGPSGLELQEALRQHGCLLPVLFLTGRDDVPSSVRAMKGGAVDFLQKPVQSDILLAALERALAQDNSQRAAREAQRRLAELFNSLTSREQKVFDRIVAGKLNKQIADELHNSERTVKTLRSQLMSKLGVDCAAGLGRLAEQRRQAIGPGSASLSGNELAPAPDSTPTTRYR